MVFPHPTSERPLSHSDCARAANCVRQGTPQSKSFETYTSFVNNFDRANHYVRKLNHHEAFQKFVQVSSCCVLLVAWAAAEQHSGRSCLRTTERAVSGHCHNLIDAVPSGCALRPRLWKQQLDATTRNKLRLNDFLIMPIQRIPRYELLLGVRVTSTVRVPVRSARTAHPHPPRPASAPRMVGSAVAAANVDGDPSDAR